MVEDVVAIKGGSGVVAGYCTAIVSFVSYCSNRTRTRSFHL